MDNKKNFHKDKEDGLIKITRFLQGKFLISKKTSIINKLKGDLDAYNAIHNKMSNEEYRDLMIKVRNEINPNPL